MSFLKHIFGQNDVESKNKPEGLRLALTSLEQLDELVALSETATCLIFKHSTRCIVSRTALKQFERDFVANAHVKLFYLDLLAYRSISNEIAARFSITHQSPQILVIKSGKVVYTASHSDIDASILERFI